MANPPQFAILNHAAVDSGIPRESATQRIGITRIFQKSIFPRHALLRTLSRPRLGAEALGAGETVSITAPPKSKVHAQ
jgi:hypothetical protein